MTQVAKCYYKYLSTASMFIKSCEKEIQLHINEIKTPFSAKQYFMSLFSG